MAQAWAAYVQARTLRQSREQESSFCGVRGDTETRVHVVPALLEFRRRDGETSLSDLGIPLRTHKGHTLRIRTMPSSKNKTPTLKRKTA